LRLVADDNRHGVNETLGYSAVGVAHVDTQTEVDGLVANEWVMHDRAIVAGVRGTDVLVVKLGQWFTDTPIDGLLTKIGSGAGVAVIARVSFIKWTFHTALFRLALPRAARI